MILRSTICEIILGFVTIITVNKNWGCQMRKTIIKLIIFFVMQVTIDVVGSEALIKGRVQNAPNPFQLSHGTTIIYELTQPAQIQLQVYNQFGQRILSENYSSNFPGGKKDENRIEISKRNFSGLDLPKGVYFYVVSSNGRVLGKGKMAIV